MIKMVKLVWKSKGELRGAKHRGVLESEDALGGSAGTFPPPRCSEKLRGKRGWGLGLAGSRGRSRTVPSRPVVGQSRRGRRAARPSAAGLRSSPCFGQLCAAAGRAHRSLCRAAATSVCRWRSPGPLCCAVFVRGVIKARLKTRASSSAARRLTSAGAAHLARTELRSGGPAVKVTEKRRPGAARQPSRCRSFPGCVRRALPSAWPLSHRQTCPRALRALGCLHRTGPRFSCAKRSDSFTAWV